MSNQPRIAVIGAGAWGRNHVRTFAALGRLQAVCDPDPAALAAIAEQYPGVVTSSSLDEILGRDDLDGVVLASPAVLHAAQARRALEAGKDVLVEKPIALDVKEAEELCALADRLDRVLMVGHLLEYHPAVLELRKMIAAGELGKVQYVYSNRLNLGRIRTDENILWSFAPHDISVLMRLLDAAPIEVRATGHSYLSEEIADVTMTQLSFPGGAHAHIFLSWLHPFKEHKLIVVGSEAMAVFEDSGPDKLKIYRHRVQWVNHRPVPDKADAEIVTISADEPLRMECQHFLDRMQDRGRPLSDGRSGVEVLRIIQACQDSLENNGAIMPLTPAPTTSAPEVFVHETATVDEPCEIGAGTRVWHYTHISPHVRIGENCVFGQNVMVAPRVTIGNRVKIQNNVSVYAGVTLEDGVFCGPSMVFTNVINPRAEIEKKSEFRPTLVQRGASLGANSTILCGNTIGEYALIAAGAVVTKDVPAYALVAGVPARQIGWACECGVTLPQEKRSTKNGSNDLTCPACSRIYELRDGALRQQEKVTT